MHLEIVWGDSINYMLPSILYNPLDASLSVLLYDYHTQSGDYKIQFMLKVAD